MKRPLAVTGLTGLCAQCLLLMVRPVFSLLFSIAALTAGVVCVGAPQIRKKTVCWVVLLTIGVVGICTSLRQLRAEPIRALDGKTVVVCGQITAIEQEENYVAVTVEAEEIINQRTDQLVGKHIRLILYTYQLPDVRRYDWVEIESVTLQAPAEGLGWSARSSYASKGVNLTGNFSPQYCKAQKGKVPWYGVFDRARQKMRLTLYTMLPEEIASVITAMVLGDRAGMDNAVQDQFRRSGLGAALVVSGLHLSILLGTVLQILRGLLRSYRIAAMCTMLLVFLFIGMTGGGGSSIRAGVSMIIWLLAIIMMRNADPLNSLGAAALVLLCIRPCIGGDLGIQLSFLAVGGILTLGKFLDEGIQARLPENWQRKKWTMALSSGLTASIGATVFTLPLTILTFGYFPVFGVVSNVLAALPIGIILMGGMAAAGFGSLGWWAAALPCGWLSGQACRFLLALTKWMAGGPVLYNTNGTLTTWLVCSMLVMGILMVIPARRRWLLTAAVLCLIPLTAWRWIDVERISHTKITALDCGDGIAVRIAAGEETVTLLAGGRGNGYKETAAYFAGRHAGEVLLIGENCDDRAVGLLQGIPQERVDALWIGWDFLPDEMYIDALPYPVTLDCGGAWSGDHIRVEPIQGVSGNFCRVKVRDLVILIPLPGSDVCELPLGKRMADMIILTDKTIKNTDLLRTDLVVFSCTEHTMETLLPKISSFTAEFYTLSSLGTVEFCFDKFGRMETFCP